MGRASLSVVDCSPEYELRKRSPKYWKVVDWVFSPSCKNQNHKIEMTKFLLARLLPVPEKQKQESIGDVRIILNTPGPNRGSETEGDKRLGNLQSEDLKD